MKGKWAVKEIAKVKREKDREAASREGRVKSEGLDLADQLK